MKLTKLVKDFGMALSKHSPEILVGLGISGMAATTVLAVRATPKAIKLIEKKADEEGCLPEELSKTEKFKLCWKCYIPAAISGVTSAACIIGAHSVNVKRNAALAAAYTLSDSALREYRDAVVETIGEEKEKVVREKVAEKQLKKNPDTNAEVIVTDRGETLCYDSLSGRYFYSDPESIREAVNNLNEDMLNDMYVSLNEFYDNLGLDHTKLGDDLGWSMDDGQVRISFSSQLSNRNKPCLVLDYQVAPRYDYNRLCR
jgi:hypothetical protein